MPWRLLAVLCDKLRQVLALQRLVGAQGTALGNAVAWGEKAKAARVLDDTWNEAFDE